MAVKVEHVRNFHLGRLSFWTLQIPVALWLFPALQRSLAYLVALSIAALIESALTDYLAARQAVAVDPTAEM